MDSATVVLYPSPGIGHLVSMVELGKLIQTHHPSLSVIILIIPATFETGATDKYIATVSATNLSLTFHHLPAITLPPGFSTEFIDLAFGIPELYNPIVHDTLVSISEKSTIKAVILDFFSNAFFQVAYSLDLPTYYFYTSGASGLCAFLYLATIHRTTSKNIKDLDIYFDIPGVPPVHAFDMPTVLFERESNSYKNFVNTSINMAKSSGIIVNSFVGLEERAVGTLRDGKCIPDGPTPPVYLIGPLIASGNNVDPNENECLKWLNSQPSKSVVFLCFGSMGVFKKEQLKEIAFGLENSGQKFLWVVREPPVEDVNESISGAKDFNLDAILPDGFLARTSDKGLVVKNWAPQPAILNNDSVGGFVSHCGWNSSLEAVVAGVPMVAWPLYAEQKMNRVYLVEEIKVALRLEMSTDGFVTAEAVEETVTKLMEGEEGKVLRERVKEMSRRAKDTVEDGGSSRIEFLKLTQPWIDDNFAGFEETAIATLRDGKCIPDGPAPPVYLIGPLIASGNNVDLNENECLKWLNSQPSKSVVFLCFGSMGVFKKEQLKEIAFGLEKSGQRFLWVVREPPSDDVNGSPHSGGKDFSLDAVLPEGFLARTSDKGLVVKNWAPQPAILNHDSVGGFVSHCGWNSSLEAVVAGVPMVAWPLYAEQKMNRVFLVDEIKVALRLKMSTDDYVTAEAVEETMTKLMAGEEGRVLRERVTELSSRAKAAVEDGGSSRADFFKLTQPWTDISV